MFVFHAADIPEEEARYWAKKLEQLNAMRDQDVSSLSLPPLSMFTYLFALFLKQPVLLHTYIFFLPYAQFYLFFTICFYTVFYLFSKLFPFFEVLLSKECVDVIAFVCSMPIRKNRSGRSMHHPRNAVSVKFHFFRHLFLSHALFIPP